MSRQSGQFAIRLSAEDADKVREALKGVGADGKSALETLGTAGEKAEKAFDGATQGARTLARQGGASLKSQLDLSSGALARIAEQIKGLSDADKAQLAAPIEKFVAEIAAADSRTEDWAAHAKRAFNDMQSELDELALKARSVDLSQVAAGTSVGLASDPGEFGGLVGVLNASAQAPWAEQMAQASKSAAADVRELSGELGRASGDVSRLKDKSDKASKGVKGLGAAGVKATPGLRAVSRVSSKIGDEMERTAQGLPLVGDGLAALGPFGIAAGLSLAAVAAGLTAIHINSKRAMREMARMVTTSENLSISVEAFQALEAQALETGVPVQQLTGMFQQMETASNQAAAGSGSMKTMLANTHPELVKQLAAAKSTAERWDIVAGAVKNAKDQTEKYLILNAVFGAQGVQMQRMLEDQDATIAGLTDKWKAQGQVLEGDLIHRVDALDTKYDRLGKRIQTNTTYAFSVFADEILGVREAMAQASDEAVIFMDRFRDIEDRSTLALQRNLKMTNEAIGELSRYGRDLDAVIDEQERVSAQRGSRSRTKQLREIGQLIGLLKQEQQIRAELDDRAAKPVTSTAGDGQNEIIRRLEEQRQHQKAARRLAQLEARAAQIRAELGDYTAVLAKREAELNELVAAGLLTREQAEISYKRYKDQLTGVAEAQRLWRSVVDAGRSSLDRLHDQLSALEADYADGKVSIDLYRAAEQALREDIAETREALRQQTEAYKDAQKVRDDLRRAAEAQMSAAERLAEKQERLNELVAAGELTQGEASDAMALYRRQLDKATDATIALRLENEILDGIFNKTINSIEDLENVFLRVLQQMVVEAIRANREIASSEGLGGFASAVFSSIGNSFSGGQGAGAAPASTGSKPFTVTEIHTGGTPGDPGLKQRRADPAWFAAAPRFHDGINLAADEHPAILQDNERVLSAAHNERLVQAVEALGGGASSVVVNVHADQGTEVETRQTQQGGNQQIDVFLTRKISSVLATGAADKAMKARYGITPGVQRYG